MGRMTEKAITVLYENGKRVYNREIDLNEAINRATEECPEVAASSARHYISWYSKMREGDILTWNSNSKLLLYYANRIIDEECAEAGEKALRSVEMFAIRNGRSELEKEVKRLRAAKLASGNGVDYLENDAKMPTTTKKAIQLIKEYISSKGFSYNDGLVENFYLCLKSKPFVILAGTSGTGKTRLVKLFADAIGAEYKMVAVRPDWSDSSDLFGHVNLNGKFIPGAILDFIHDAQDDPERPYILCLDEMNLARVEYYFSDFLSIIETRELRDGEIVSDALVSPEQYADDTEAKTKYGEVRFPQNLYLVGTVNMDETTFPFSKKVLDRANTIEFNTVDLTAEMTEMAETKTLTLSNDFLKTQYLLLAQTRDESEYVAGICSELQSINNVLQKANAHVGYRVRDEIVFYMLSNKESGLISEDDAMDNEILQKILPRIQGSSASVKEMLCDLFKHFVGDYEGYSTNTEDTAAVMLQWIKNRGCRFRKSAEKVVFMVKRFEEDGFTSYWL